MTAAAVPWAYVAIVSQVPLEAAELDDIATRAEPTLPFLVQARAAWCSDDRSLALLAFAGAGAVDPGCPWSVTPAGITAFSGLPVPQGGWWHPRSAWAAQLAASLVARPVGDVAADLFGTFTIAHLRADGAGVLASDAPGVAVLYRADRNRRTAVATRASLARVAAHPGAPAAPDVTALGWLLSFDNLVGTGTGDEAVVALPARTVVDIAAGRVALRVAELDSGPVPEDPLAALAAVVSQRLHVLAAAPEPVSVGLTGGRDSRVLLALATAAGLAASFRWLTWDLDAEDVTISRQLARHSSLHHDVIPLGLRAWPEHVDDLLARSEGMLPATELAATAGTPGLVISGIGGELLGAYFGAHRPVDDVAAARATLVDRVARPDTILTSDAIAGYVTSLGTIVDELASRVPADDIGTNVYLDHRMHRWQGTVRESGARTDLAPLVSPLALAAARAVPHEARRRHAVHEALVARAAPRLWRLPFATGTRPMSAVDHWTLVASVLRDELGVLDGPLASIIDVARVKQLLADHAQPSGHVVRQLVVAHGLGRWLARPAPDRAQPPPSSSPNSLPRGTTSPGGGPANGASSP